MNRCAWPANDSLMIRYHDEEWGVPVHNDLKWFEYIVLDAFQAGLSWRTVLHKRQNFRDALDGFEPSIIAGYGPQKIESLLQNPGIIRNKLKIHATITNAQCFLELQKQVGSFDQFIWGFTEGQVIQNTWKTMRDIPPSTTLSDTISKAMKNKGFKFVDSTIVYAFLQSGGIVNDHVSSCFRHAELL